MIKNYLFILFFFFGTQVFSQAVSHTLEHDGETRTYEVYLPSNYVDGDELPLVINMHGLGSNAIQQALYSGFNVAADANNFIVVYPQGLEASIGTHWNAYFGTGVDDIGFLGKMIDQIYLDYNINLSRVYSTGMSNGGYMSYVLACEMSDRIAAIASVTGAMTMIGQSLCTNPRAMPVMEIHGTDDATVPYLGDGQNTVSAPDAIQFWVDQNNCDESAKITTAIEDIDMTDNTTATLERYPTCDEGVEVHFYTIQDGGHTWPGAFPVGALGNTNQDINATQVIWDFFNQFTHPNPTPVVTSTQNIANEWDIKIAPNPFSNRLQIENKENDIYTFRMTNVLGQTIGESTQIVAFENKSLNTSTLQSGIYFMIMENENGRLVKKLIKE